MGLVAEESKAVLRTTVPLLVLVRFGRSYGHHKKKKNSRAERITDERDSHILFVVVQTKKAPC